jgi:hypothetical protein
VVLAPTVGTWEITIQSTRQRESHTLGPPFAKLSGWWLSPTYPSEKYDFVSWDDYYAILFPYIMENHVQHVWNHQAVMLSCFITSLTFGMVYWAGYEATISRGTATPNAMHRSSVSDGTFAFRTI